VLDIVRDDPDGAVFDVGMAAFVTRDFDAKRIFLVLLCQRDDAARQRRREQQRAAGVRRGFQDEFQILAEAEIEHFIGLVEHDGFQLRDIETTAPQVIAQPPRRSDHNMRADAKLAPFTTRVHAADAGNNTRASVLIEPRELALHLQGKFARGRDDQCQGLGASFETIRVAEEVLRNRQSIRNGLAGAGLR